MNLNDLERGHNGRLLSVVLTFCYALKSAVVEHFKLLNSQYRGLSFHSVTCYNVMPHV